MPVIRTLIANAALLYFTPLPLPLPSETPVIAINAAGSLTDALAGTELPSQKDMEKANTNSHAHAAPKQLPKKGSNAQHRANHNIGQPRKHN